MQYRWICQISSVPLTEFHEQSQEDPQRDLEGLPDVLVVEGEDGESLLLIRGVIPGMEVRLPRLCHPARVPPRPVALPRNLVTTRGGTGSEQQHAGEEPGETRCGAATAAAAAPGSTEPEGSHFQKVSPLLWCRSEEDEDEEEEEEDSGADRSAPLRTGIFKLRTAEEEQRLNGVSTKLLTSVEGVF